ncbi:energy transducer TonB [Lysobacter tyrosinilyticus]
MVHTLALRPDRTHTRFQIGKPDFTRITAEAGAIAIHGAALLLLLAPMNMHVPQVAPHEVTYEYIPLKPKDNPLPPPKQVEVVKRVVPTTPTAVPQKVERQPIPVADPQPGDTAADQVEVAKVDPGLGDAIIAPLVGAHLEYEAAPPPPYPPQAIRDGLMGTVVLRVLVGIDGKAIEVQIERSSGHRLLDAAAKRQVLAKWRFRPAMQDGRSVQAIGLIPIEFNL